MKKLFLIVAMSIAGCASTPKTDPEVEAFYSWHRSSEQRVKSGEMKPVDFYVEQYDRLAALPRIPDSDAAMKFTAQIIPIARKLDKGEISRSDFEDQKRILGEKSREEKNAKMEAESQQILQMYLANQANQPKPSQAQMPQRRKSINCTSSAYGQTVYTNCE